MFMKIRKRDSREVGFDESKITEAISRAALAVYGKTKVSTLSSMIEKIFGFLFGDERCSCENSPNKTRENTYTIYLRSIIDFMERIKSICKLVLLNIRKRMFLAQWSKFITIICQVLGYFRRRKFSQCIVPFVALE